jgi:carbonic anhydrase
VVLGHAQCGGVAAMIEGAPEEARDFVAPWMAIAAPVLKDVPDSLPASERLSHCEAAVIRLSLANLITFPWIEEAVAAGRLQLAGFRFGIATGVLEVLEGDRLVPVE